MTPVRARVYHDPYVKELRERCLALEKENLDLRLLAAGKALAALTEMQAERAALQQKLAAALARIDKLLKET